MSDRYRKLPDSKQPIQMKQMTMNAYRKQFQKDVDEALVVVQDIVTNTNNMNKHITTGNAKLDQLNDGLDNTGAKMKKANDLIESYLNSASNCCLYSYIAIALFIFLLLVSI